MTTTLFALLALQDFVSDEYSAEWLKRFRAAAAQHQWEVVFRTYDEARTKHAGRLVADGDIRRDAAEFLAREIVRMPAALRWWRDKYSYEASRAYDDAEGDPLALVRFADKFRFDERADDALNEAGEYWRLVDEHPQSGLPLAVTLARIAAGRDPGDIERVRARNIDGPIMIGDEPGTLRSFLDRLSAAPPPRAPMPGEPPPPLAGGEVELWRHSLAAGSHVPTSARIGNRDAVLVTDGRVVLAIDPARAPAPCVLWRFEARLTRHAKPHGWNGVTVADGIACATVTGSRLVGLSLRGDLRWEADCGEESLLCGPPVARDGAFIAVVMTVRATEASVGVLSIDGRTGERRWTRDLGYAMFARGHRAPVATLAQHGGVVYVQTNLGATAAIDASTGRVRWLATYPRNGRDLRPASAPAVARGRLYALAQDAGDCLVFDAETGRRLEPLDLPGARQLAGVVGDYLVVLGSPSRVVHLPTLRAFELPLCDVVADARPALADGRFYVVARQGLTVFDTASWRVIESTPMREIGHLAVAGDRIVVGAAVFASKFAVARAFERRLSASPPDPQARLEYERLLTPK